jgi:hypothetical protein
VDDKVLDGGARLRRSHGIRRRNGDHGGLAKRTVGKRTPSRSWTENEKSISAALASNS